MTKPKKLWVRRGNGKLTIIEERTYMVYFHTSPKQKHNRYLIGACEMEFFEYTGIKLKPGQIKQVRITVVK